MAGNSWQQPVSGEPSCGTLHLIVPTTVFAVNPVASAYTVVDLSTWIPAGAICAYGELRVASSTEGDFSALGKTTAYTATAYLYKEVVKASSGGFDSVVGFIPITSSRTCVRRDSSGNISAVRFVLMGYTV